MRPVAIAALVGAFAVCTGAHPQPTAAAPDRAGGIAADPERSAEPYARALALEKETARRTVLLDRKVEALLAAERRSDLRRRHGSAPNRIELRALVPRDEERQLAEADAALNRALLALYAAAWRDADAEGELRAALLHWTVLLRRALMEDFHTRVAGLENDRDCAGDMVGDGLLQRYFDAVLAHRETAAALALADIARQSACLGVDQSRRLADAVVRAFEELRIFLRLHGHEGLVPYVVQAGSSPLLLFHDVEKYRGADAPLSRWFREHRDILREGVERRRHPASWHGLWLYDRRTGRLFGYRATATPVDENDVDLVTFFSSITHLENLGLANCSFAEMVERGVGVMGYLCAGSSCGRDTHRRRPASLDFLGLSAAEKAFDVTTCRATGDGRGGRGSAPKCGDAALFGGRNRAADTVRCLTAQIVRAGAEGLHCFAEASGQCSDPRAGLVKNFQPQQMRGVKVGRDCALSAGMGDVKVAEREAEEKRKQQDKALRDEIERLKALIGQLENELKDLEKSRDDKQLEANKDYLGFLEAEKSAKEAGLDPSREPIVVAAKERAAESAKIADVMQDVVNDTKMAIERARAQLERKEEEKQKREEQKDGQEGQRCVRDDPNCGDDRCSAMSQATRDALACVQGALSGEKRQPTRTGGCDPSNCDPVEPAGDAPGTLACFVAIAKEPGAALSRQCWAVRCEAGTTPVAGANGCTCQAGGGGFGSGPGGGMGFCGQILCAEGTPTFSNGRCSCGGEGHGGGGIGRLPPGGPRGSGPGRMPVIDAPPTYSEIRFGRP